MARRFESEFDPEELSKITHHGLQSLSRRNDEPRVTQDHIVSLKQRQKEEGKLGVTIHRFFAHMLGGIVSAFKSLFTPARKKVTQCQTYGHSLKPGWTGANPVCIDCGAAILSLNEVRGATPKDERKNSSGPNPFQGTERKYVK